MKKLRVYFKRDGRTLSRVKSKEHPLLYNLIVGIWPKVLEFHTPTEDNKRPRGRECVFSLVKEDYDQLLKSLRVEKSYDRSLPLYYGGTETVLFVLKEREEPKETKILPEDE